MRDTFQFLLDVLSKWGFWALVAAMLIPAAALLRLWRQRRVLQRQALVRRAAWHAWSIATLAILTWVLEVQLAPLTHSLRTLQAGTGERVPDILFRSASEGALHRLGEFEGKVVLLNLWATYCSPCLEQLPALARLQKAHEDRLVVLALSDEPAQKVCGYVAKHPVELLIGYTEFFDWLKVEAFRPFPLIIDRRGILQEHFFGSSDYDGWEAQIRPYLED